MDFLFAFFNVFSGFLMDDAVAGGRHEGASISSMPIGISSMPIGISSMPIG